MKIVIGNPPNIKKIKKYFNVPKNAVFTYGDTIYNPNKAIIDEHLEKHEEVHTKQHGNDPSGWWERYFQDKEFRLSQEAAAYRVQYQSAKNVVRDREWLNKYLHKMAFDLSSHMYGNIISHQDAVRLIIN